MAPHSMTRFQLAILAEPGVQIDGLPDTASVEWLLCKQTSEYSFDFYKDDAIVSSVNLEDLRLDLQDLVGIIVVGSPTVFEVIKGHWRTKLPTIALAFRQISTYNQQTILTVAMECFADCLREQRIHSGHTALELATYRREFERLQHNFSRLEEFVGRQSLQRPAEIFEYPPYSASETTADNAEIGLAGRSGLCLMQPLPVDSIGVSSFSIYVKRKPQGATDPLLVSLKAIETGQIFGTWSIAGSEAPIGWLDLALLCAIDEPALNLVIVIEWPATTGWALAVGPPHPYKEFVARRAAGDYLAAPIAFRVFSSLPGVHVPATITSIRPIRAPHALRELIPDQVCESVAQVHPANENDKSVLVFYDKDIRCITVHPRKGGLLTVARMNVLVPKHAWRVSAQIHLANERASQTHFSLMICTSQDGRRELQQLERGHTPADLFAHWKTLLPLEKKRISALIPIAHEDMLSIYFATRQDPDSSPDFGWARFSSFEFNILPKSLISVVGPNLLDAISGTATRADSVERLSTETASLEAAPNVESI
jgi:hypothetical protein